MGQVTIGGLTFNVKTIEEMDHNPVMGTNDMFIFGKADSSLFSRMTKSEFEAQFGGFIDSRTVGFADITKIFSDTGAYPKYDATKINLYVVTSEGNYDDFADEAGDPKFTFTSTDVIENEIMLVRNANGDWSVSKKSFGVTDDIEIGNPKAATSNGVAQLIYGGFGPEQTYGAIGHNMMYAVDTEEYIMLREDLSSTDDRQLTAINIYTGDAGNVIFSLGSIDQHDKWIERKQFTLTLASGDNSIAVDEMLFANEHLAIKFPSTIPLGFMQHPPNGNRTVFYPMGSAATRENTNTFSYWFNARVKTSDQIVSLKTDLDEVEAEVQSLQAFASSPTFTKPDGTKVKLIFNTDGSVNWEAIGYSRVVHLGNSLALHSIIPGIWWNECGMAASTAENDYVHQFEALLSADYPGLVSEVYNIADWEANHATFDLTTLAPCFANDPDLVIFRLGENVSNSTGFENDYKALIEYAKTQCPPDTVYIVGGQFWTNTTKEGMIQNAAAAKSAIYVPLSHLDNSTYKSYMGATVYDAAGNPHAITDGGVANHPNDAGMLAIAQALYNAVP